MGAGPLAVWQVHVAVELVHAHESSLGVLLLAAWTAGVPDNECELNEEQNWSEIGLHLLQFLVCELGFLGFGLPVLTGLL